MWDAHSDRGDPARAERATRCWVSSVAFSPDGTRIVTSGVIDSPGTKRRCGTCADRDTCSCSTSKATRSGVSSVSFSPDGSWIVTGGGELMASTNKPGEAKVWDAHTGTLLFDLKGHTGWVWTVSFSPDGTRIFTRQEYPAVMVKAWDAQTGQEVKGKPIPPTLRPSPVSPDGHWIAHVAGYRVELVPLQVDADELEYRRIHTRPNIGRYLEGYDTAIKLEDHFAARFYLNLLPPPVRTRHFAEAIVTRLFARWPLRDEVLAALKAQPAADPEVQAACLELAGAWTQFAGNCNNVAWSLVREPGQPDVNYQRGLRLAKAACELEPEGSQINDDGGFLKTLGVAQYRCGLAAEALATLTKSNDLNKEKDPADLAFLALAENRLGQSEKARSTLGRLRELMKDPARAKDQEAQALLREAETIELDQAFPANPFAP